MRWRVLSAQPPTVSSAMQPSRSSLGRAVAIPALVNALSCLRCRIPPLPRWTATPFAGRVKWKESSCSLQQRYPCSRGWKSVQWCPQQLPLLMSQNLKRAATTSNLAQFCFYAFTEGLPAPARLWQELPEQFSGFYLQEFLILILVLDTYLVYHQHPDGVTASLRVCSRGQGNWLSPLVCLETSLVFMSPLQFLIYFLRVFTDNIHKEILGR